MRQFDIVRLAGGTYAVVLQADLLDATNTVVVAPLVRDKTISHVRRLHPVVRVGRHEYVMLTEKLSGILRSEVASVAGTVRDRDYDMRRALDIVFVGV